MLFPMRFELRLLKLFGRSFLGSIWHLVLAGLVCSVLLYTCRSVSLFGFCDDRLTASFVLSVFLLGRHPVTAHLG